MAIADLISQLRIRASTFQELGTFGIALWTVALLSVVYSASWSWRLLQNYQRAKQSGLPILVVPVNPNHLLWMIIQHTIRPLLQRFLSEYWYERLQVCCHGWEWTDKIDLHQKYGSAFILVTPNKSELWCGDPVMAAHLLQQRRDFTTHHMSRVVMGFMGSNLIISDGDDWTRQRRLIAPHLNERISAGVWAESLAQAAAMRSYFLSQPGGATRETVAALRAVAINVLARVGYGENKPFAPYETPRDPSQMRTYVDAVGIVCEFIPLPALVPAWLAELPIMPSIIRTLGAALRKMPGLTAEMVEQERKKIREGGQNAKENMMSMLVRFSDEAKEEKGQKTEGGKGQFLTDEEISGNLLVFSAAGFDTTANTMGYAAAFLSAKPEWQEWVQEELDEVLAEAGTNVDDADYATVFPKLQRCLAVMYETLRLCPPVIHLSRSNEGVTLSVPSSRGTQHLLVGDHNININSSFSHQNPEIWGTDSFEFRPTRWLIPSSSGGPPEFFVPQKGTYFPWSTGPRACPGMKMAQVEFIATFSGLFANLRAEPVVAEGQGMEEAKTALMGVIADSVSHLTLLMNRPRDMHVRWVPR